MNKLVMFWLCINSLGGRGPGRGRGSSSGACSIHVQINAFHENNNSKRLFLAYEKKCVILILKWEIGRDSLQEVNNLGYSLAVSTNKLLSLDLSFIKLMLSESM